MQIFCLNDKNSLLAEKNITTSGIISKIDQVGTNFEKKFIGCYILKYKNKLN